MASVMKAGEFPKLPLKRFPKIQERETAEARYWKNYKNVIEHKFQSSPTYIDFNPLDASSYIVTASIRVHLFDSLNDKMQRAYSRFDDDAFSAKFRKDGRLIVAGDKSSCVKVFDVKTKSVLRQMKRHTAAVRCTTWTSDGLKILSASDDKKVFRWDLGTEELLWTSKSSHSDYVRALDANPASPDIFLSGSYDHTLKLWDSRQQDPAVEFPRLKSPINFCLFTPSGSMALTAAGSEVQVWDVLGGGRLLHTFNNHQKNVSFLGFDGTGTRVLSAGLDGHIKVYNLQTMQVAHGMKFDVPLVSVAVSPNDKKYVVGCVDGSLIIKNLMKDLETEGLNDIDAVTGRKPSKDLPFSYQKEVRGKDNLTQQRFHRGAGKIFQKEGIIETERKHRLQGYEKYLKRFEYQHCLDVALQTHNPVIVVSVLEELGHRNGLIIALSGRDEITLEPILSFITRYVNLPKYSKLLIQVAHIVLDIYFQILGQSEIIDELFGKLHKQVRNEVGFNRDILRVLGALDGIISAATMPKPKAEAMEIISSEIK